MNKILVYILIFLTFSCVEKKKESKSDIKVEKKERISINTDSTELKAEPIVETKKSDSLFIDPNDFKYSNLKEFDLRNWYIGKMDEELKSPTKEKLVNYIQNERLTLENVYPNSWKYFSIQKNEELEKIITIIEGDESCCSDLHYLVYNEQNELLSDNIIAGTGGDGMWAYDQYGKFINDSTYILTRIDMEEIELANGGTETQIDSVITNYRFYKNKPFKKLTEQKFKKVEKH
jgi:hypothetical protein